VSVAGLIGLACPVLAGALAAAVGAVYLFGDHVKPKDRRPRR
jgi:hypothetical protein